MELNFDLGIKEYIVKGAKGETVIRFSPTDANFARRAYETFTVLEKKQKERAELINEKTSSEEAFEFTKRIDEEMRNSIDELFGCPVCEGVFGIINLYSMAGGSPVWLNFMNAILEQFDENIKRERYSIVNKSTYFDSPESTLAPCCVLNVVQGFSISGDFERHIRCPVRRAHLCTSRNRTITSRTAKGHAKPHTDCAIP